jgi:hypothetical protein
LFNCGLLIDCSPVRKTTRAVVQKAHSMSEARSRRSSQNTDTFLITNVPSGLKQRQLQISYEYNVFVAAQVRLVSKWRKIWAAGSPLLFVLYCRSFQLTPVVASYTIIFCSSSLVVC